MDLLYLKLKQLEQHLHLKERGSRGVKRLSSVRITHQGDGASRCWLEPLESRVLLSSTIGALLYPDHPDREGALEPTAIVSKADPVQGLRQSGSESAVVGLGGPNATQPVSVALPPVAPNGAAIGLNFRGAERFQPGTGSPFPPDTMGTVGMDHVIVMINGSYSVFNKLDGSLITRTTLDQFWTNAGINPSGSFDPRILYDPGEDRFYATSVNNQRADNEILFAISNTGDPFDGWEGFAVDSDSNNGQRWADYPQMSFDADGIYIGADMFDIPGGAMFGAQRSTLVLPKSDLLDGNPSIENATLIEDHVTLTGPTAQGVVYASAPANGLPAAFLSALGGAGDGLVFSFLNGPVDNPSFAFQDIVDITARATPPLADQPDDDGIAGLDLMGRRITSKVEFVNNAYWGSHTVRDPVTNNAAIRFFEISTGGALLQEVFITHPDLDFAYPSIAVNGDEDVILGFTASGDNEFASSYAVIGETVAGNTTFSAPFRLSAGTATYQALDNQGRNRWGDYSATVLDPADPRVFWTFQEIAIGATEWAVQVTQILLDGTPTTGNFLELNPFGDASEAGVIDNPADRDTFAFATDAAGSTQVTVTEGLTLFDAAAGLWDLDDDVLVDVDLDTVGDDPQITADLLARNLYSVETFSESGTGGYTVEVDGPSAPLTQIVLDEDGSGSSSTSILNFADTDYFALAAPLSATGNLAVTMDPAAGLDGVVSLYDANGDLLERSQFLGAGGTETLQFTSVVPGDQYFVRVGAFQYGSSGTYDLEVNFAVALPAIWTTNVEGFATFHIDGVSRNALSFNALLNFPDDLDSYYFASHQSGDYTIAVGDEGGAVDPIVAVYRADTGTLLGFDDDGGPGDDAELTLGLDGFTRYIVVVADDDGNETGPVPITITAPDPGVAAQVIAIAGDGIGSPGPRTISPATDADFFRFTTPENTIGTGSITISPDPSLAPVAVLFDAAGQVVARSNTPTLGSPAVVNLFALDPSTDYFLTVHANDYATADDYTVDVMLDLFGSISGTKFADEDGDGVQGPTEPGLRSWTIFADLNNNGMLDGGEPSTITDDDGHYELTGLVPGQAYVIAEFEQVGWTQTTPSIGVDAGLAFLTVELSGADRLTILEPPATTTPGALVNGGHNLGSLAWDHNTQTLYSISRLLAEDTLVTVDPLTGDVTTVGTGLGAAFTNTGGLAFDSSSNLLYTVDLTADVLLEINPATGLANVVGAGLGFGGVGDLAYDFVREELFGVDFITDQLVTIDRTSGAAAAVGATGIDIFDGLAFDPVTETIYGQDSQTLQIVTVNPNTGATGVFAGPFDIQVPLPLETLHRRGTRVIILDENGESVDQVHFGNQPDGVDYGDAPSPTYPTLRTDDGARHAIIPGASILGSEIDREPDGLPNATATGDDQAGNDDEDGVTFTSPLVIGQMATVDIAMSGNALLQAWIDFNGDGDWDDLGEQIFTDEPVAAGNNPLSFDVPLAGSVGGQTFARFRVSREGGLSYDGLAVGGEVEDYMVEIQDTTPPQVVEVRVGSTAWTAPSLADGHAIPVGNGDQHMPLPWNNINQIIITFSEDIGAVSDGDFDLTGPIGGSQSFMASYDASTFTATLDLAGDLDTDALTLTVFDTIADLFANALDGEWDNPTDLLDPASDTYPSGDGTTGGDFIFRFNVLPGDANQDGSVSIADFSDLQNNFNQPGNHNDGDFNGDGFVTFADFATLQNHFNQTVDTTFSGLLATVVAGVTSRSITTAAQPSGFPFIQPNESFTLTRDRRIRSADHAASSDPANPAARPRHADAVSRRRSSKPTLIAIGHGASAMQPPTQRMPRLMYTLPMNLRDIADDQLLDPMTLVPGRIQ